MYSTPGTVWGILHAYTQQDEVMTMNPNSVLSQEPSLLCIQVRKRLQNHDAEKVNHSLCNTTINPITPSNTVFNHGCSLNMIVTYPTPGIYPRTLPTISSLRSRKSCPRAYSSVSSARLLSPFVSSFWGATVGRLLPDVN